MERWLEGYAYRVEMGWMPFLVAGGLISPAAAVTVAAQTLRVGLANPVDALRYE